MTGALAILASRFAFVAVSTFLAIIVWARVRDAAWMFMVVGVVAGYADILYALLGEFGLQPRLLLTLAGADPLAMILPNLPWLFFSIAFAVMARRKRP